MRQIKTFNKMGEDEGEREKKIKDQTKRERENKRGGY